MQRIATLPIERPEDVYALRQSARAAAAAVGCDQADQVRLATALSELGREVLAHGRAAAALLMLDGDGALRIEIEPFPHAGTLDGPTMTGLDAARRLIDDVTVVAGHDPQSVTVSLKRLPSGVARREADDVRAALLRAAAPRPLDELRLANRDLVTTLDELKRKQDELLRLNGELEETNRGVMAMYNQLSGELEETNRGVVALYAELDDKSVRLKEANEAKSRFLGNVSHELRSPVNSILGLARLLADPQADALTEEQSAQLRFILQLSDELLRMVNELLDLAKAESGRLEPQVAMVDLQPLFGELRGALRPIVREGVELRVDAGGVSRLETDRVLLTHVLRNLLTNALKFTASGTVQLVARQTVGYAIEIAVTDTGIGIAPDDLPRVFEEFFQVRGPLQAEHKGTGLGLPYARRVTESLGGELQVESEVGRGSTFTVRLPSRWHRPVREDSDERTVTVGAVLIVDDDPTFRTALRGMLQGVARQVIESGGGVDGLRRMRADRPALVFIDLRMPDLDGADVLAAMKSDPELQDIPAVIVSSAELSPVARTTLGAATALLAKTNLDRESVRDVILKVFGEPSG